jgi:hypothetical protein
MAVILYLFSSNYACEKFNPQLNVHTEKTSLDFDKKQTEISINVKLR